MATKANPGKFDCYANAAPDEPLFVLRSTDPVAPQLVRIWAALRADSHYDAALALEDAQCVTVSRKGRKDDKYIEALACADAMEKWKAERGV